MNMDAVHEMPSFSDQTAMPVHSNILEENVPYEAAYSYDELFPSLPENDMKPEVPVVDMGQWTQKMKLKTSVITQVFHVPVEERKFRDGNSQQFGEQGEQVKICAHIMEKTNAHIEISSSKDQRLTILVTGKEEAVLKARRQIIKELQTQASVSIPIPKEHHRFIIGPKGKNLTDLEQATATKITVPRPEENSDLIKITGTKESIDRAHHEIQIISDEQAKLAFERLNIPKVYHPFICGPFNEVVSQIANETGARINIPPPSVMKDELTIAGEKEAVAQAKETILEIYEDKKRNCQVVSVEVPKYQHKYIIGFRGQSIQEILHDTSVSVEIPPAESPCDTIILRGEQSKLGDALTAVYVKANSVKLEFVEAPSWLHKYIIGKKGANIKQLTQDLTKVQVDFTDDQDTIKVEGPPKEVDEACQKLREMTENLKKQVIYEEIFVNPEYHRHIIGKNGSNINRLKEETKTLINIPSNSEHGAVRIEGSPEAVAQVKQELLDMVHKMENEITRELNIDQRFHRNIIGAKGENIRGIRDKFNQVNITFPEPGLRSNKVNIRGPKEDVDGCYRYLSSMAEEIKTNNYSVEVPINKQAHKFVIGKAGAVIRKIRDETRTRIDLPSECADSDVITITGRKEDVISAKEKILAIQEEQGNVVTQEIIIPAKLHNSIIGAKGRIIRSITEECGGVTVKFPSGGTGSDKVSIRGSLEDVKRAKKKLIDMSNEKQLTSFSAEIRCQPEYHKFLIGKSGANIRKVRDKTNAKIVFPTEHDEDKDTITIFGRQEEVDAAKAELEELILELEKTVEIKMDVDPKHHRFFVARRGEVLRKIGEDFGGVTVSFPRNGSDSSEVTLKGEKEAVEAAKRRIEEIVRELEEMITIECEIQQEHHRTVLGTRGSKVQSIQQKYNVTIKFPDKMKQEEYNERATMNGDYHSDVSDVEQISRNIVYIKGKQEDCEGAKQELLSLVPISAEVEVPYDMHRFIIGQKGKDVRSMMVEFDVNISIPSQMECSNIITIKGPPENVEKTKVALKERIEKLEQEKEERELRNYKTIVEVDPKYHPKIIGRSGMIISKIRTDHNVIINFPERDATSDNIITITGYEKDAEAAKADILKLVEEQENMYKEDVLIDSRVHSRIIGSRGRNILKVMSDFKVDIRFPRSNEQDVDPDLVVIQGAEDDVLDAKEHLLNMEEEYLQDIQGRESTRQYTQPPSRHIGNENDGNRTNDRGFVVKGAPWDKRRDNVVPDTTNTQEFPSFGTAAEVPAKAVAWGPARR